MKAKAHHSDPAWNGTFRSRWIWPFRGKGVLQLTEDSLKYESRRLALQLPRDRIHSIGLEQCRIGKPAGLIFLDIGFTADDGAAQHVYFLPLPEGRISWLNGVRKTNEIVERWLSALREWKGMPSFSSMTDDG